ncbi:MAG: YaaL family protein [Eubacterium sp.]|nr:YaaL family protein [Eubacterium sp.]
MSLRKKNPVIRAREDLIKEIEDLKQALETTNSNFENTCDPDLIDSYIYEMNAISFRYRYLLRQMREMELET